MTTMKEVAAEAGVSTATVSAVINKNKYVSPELTDRVEEAIKKLNYVPNRMARGLASKKTYIFAYLVPSISNPIFAETVEGMEEAVSSQDYTVSVVNTNFNIDRYLHDARRLANNTDGIAITASHDKRINKLVFELIDRKVPVVVIHSPTDTAVCPVIKGDDFQGIGLAIDHLVERGHKEIGFVGVNQSTSCRIRHDGYRKGLHKNGLQYKESLSYFGQKFSGIKGQYGLDLNNNDISLFLDKNPDMTAIIASSDSLAIDIYKQLYKSGIKVPEDIALVGFDNTLAPYVCPGLTSIYLPCKEMGNLAGKLLLHLTSNKGKSFIKKDIKLNRKKLIKERLVIREST